MAVSALSILIMVLMLLCLGSGIMADLCQAPGGDSPGTETVNEAAQHISPQMGKISALSY